MGICPLTAYCIKTKDWQEQVSENNFNFGLLLDAVPGIQSKQWLDYNKKGINKLDTSHKNSI